MATEIAHRITVDPAVMVGKPVIKGARMPVELVPAKLAANPDLDEFLLDYPELTVDDVKAVLHTPLPSWRRTQAPRGTPAPYEVLPR